MILLPTLCHHHCQPWIRWHAEHWGPTSRVPVIEDFRWHQHQCLGWFLGIGPSSQLKSAETAAVATSLQSLQLLSFMWLFLSLLARQLRKCGLGLGMELAWGQAWGFNINASTSEHASSCPLWASHYLSWLMITVSWPWMFWGESFCLLQEPALLGWFI